MDATVFDFQKLNEQFGITSDLSAPVTAKGIIADDDIDKVSKILQSSDRKALNLEPDKVEEKEPDYLEDYKELLSTKLEIPEDETNYSERAVNEFGKDFAHLNSRDAFQDELFTREYKDEFLSTKLDPRSRALVEEILEGRYDKGKLVRDEVAAAMQRNETYTEEAFDARMKLYFDEEGNLNSEGLQRYNSFLSHYKTAWSNVNHEAEKYAAKELTKYKDLMRSVSTQLKTTKIGGVVLPEDLAGYIENNIKSGKVQDWLTAEPKTPEEAAAREIQLAIISDPKIFAEWFKLVTDLGVKHGVNQKAKQIFN